MTQRKTALTTIKLAAVPIFTALVTVATMVFVISIPATTGYFNIGEAVIYVAAILFGPYVGAISGGVGAAIADLILAPVYAPATLIIKAFEGAIVGFLSQKTLKLGSKSQWKIFTIAAGLVTGVLLSIIGTIYYSGEVQLFFGMPPPQDPTVTFSVPVELWYALGVLVVVLTAFVGFKLEPRLGWQVLAIFLGGLEMVAGYFIYQQFVMEKAAVVEIPVNIGQMLIGLILAIPVAKAVWRALPTLKETQE